MSRNYNLSRIFIPKELAEEIKGKGELHIELSISDYDVNHIGDVIEVSGQIKGVAVK